MEQLEQKIIETAFKKIDTLSDDELEKLCENYVEIQPELLDYVISASWVRAFAIRHQIGHKEPITKPTRSREYGRDVSFP